MNGDRSGPGPGALRLLRPGQLGPYTVANRLIMAPMTRNRARRDGVPSASAVIYYAQRASAGCLITEATAVSSRAVGYPFTPGIHTAEQVEGWRPVVDAVHRLGSRIFLQLFHAGRVSHPSLLPAGVLPLAPSAIAAEGYAHTYEGPVPFTTPRALASDEIPGVIEEFRTAARNALLAGFDGVEVHGANGYLLDQFIRDGSNRRTDRYGGSPSNRVRFPVEVVRAVATIWGADRVGVRISPLNGFNSMFDSSPETTFGTLVAALRGMDLAYLHVAEEDSTPHSGPRFDLDGLRRIWHGSLRGKRRSTTRTRRRSTAAATGGTSTIRSSRSHPPPSGR